MVRTLQAYVNEGGLMPVDLQYMLPGRMLDWEGQYKIKCR